MRYLPLFFILLLACYSSAAPALDDKEVILIVSSQRHDLEGERLELAVRSLRHKLGFSTEELPVVRMGMNDQDSQAQHFERLQLTSEQLPAICLVQWSKPASEGPKSVLGEFLVGRVAELEAEDKARFVLIGWLRRNGKENLISLIEPEVPPSPPEPLPAEIALQEGRFEEAIDLAREGGHSDLEHQARQGLETQAALAYSEGREADALKLYQTLRRFYPADSHVESKILELSARPADQISGKWELRSASGWIKFTAFPDGRLEGRGALYLVPFPAKMSGHWETTGETERTFQLHWRSGQLHNIQLHEDETSFEGRGLSDGNISGRRLEPKP